MNKLTLVSGVALSVVLMPMSTIFAQPRQLSFEERVQAQEALDRVYYSHQIGDKKPFGEAIAREVLEQRVLRYLKQSAALENFWHTNVTVEMLERELERMARGTRIPQRLMELYAALDNDLNLILECLARPALVDRLARNFFASDERIHGDARREAEALREDLSGRGIDPLLEDPRRMVLEVTREAELPRSTLLPDAHKLRGLLVADPLALELSPERFEDWIRALPQDLGEIGPLVETEDGFSVQIVVEREADRVRVVTYKVDKRSWEDWWAEAEAWFPETKRATPVSSDHHTYVPAGLDVRYQPRVETDVPASCGPDDAWDNGILDEPTHGRVGHTSVWTGSLMVVWGGQETLVAGGGVAPPLFRTGGRYDPATDTWRPTSTTNAPSGRYAPSAVWTGSVMVVWGGSDEDGAVNTGGRYDPASDTWSPVSTNDAPSGRLSHSAVWTGNFMVVWGGRSGGDYLDTGGLYDPVTDTWKPTSTISAPQARSNHTAIWTGSAMVVWGGEDASGDRLDTGGRYNPATDVWSATDVTEAPSARTGHTAVWTGSMMVVWGGVPDGWVGMGVATGGRYDPVADQWTPTSVVSAPSGRYAHSAVWTGNLMVIWGGISGVEDATGGRYDPVTDQWAPTSVTNAPSGRYAHSAVWTGNLVVVWGGYDRIARGGYGPFHLNTGGRYDPADLSDNIVVCLHDQIGNWRAGEFVDDDVGICRRYSCYIWFISRGCVVSLLLELPKSPASVLVGILVFRGSLTRVRIRVGVSSRLTPSLSGVGRSLFTSVIVCVCALVLVALRGLIGLGA